MPLALNNPSSASLRMMFHPSHPRLQTLTHCTTPLLDAQWLCLRYASRILANVVTLTCAWSEWPPLRRGGRAGQTLGKSIQLRCAYINDIAVRRLVTGYLSWFGSVQNRIVKIGAVEGARNQDQPFGCVHIAVKRLQHFGSSRESPDHEPIRFHRYPPLPFRACQNMT